MDFSKVIEPIKRDVREIKKLLNILTKEKMLYLTPIFAIIVGGTIVKSSFVTTLVYGFVFVLSYLLMLDRGKGKELRYELIFAFPVYLSVIQNVYLGLIIVNITSMDVKLLVVLNVVYVIIWSAYYVLAELKNNKAAFLYCVFMVVFAAYCMYTAVKTDAPMTLAISNMRNIMVCFIFFLFGYMATNLTDLKTINRVFIIMGLAVILVGFYEIFIDQRMWVRLDIDQIWESKGIAVNNLRVPKNFYSSERFNGKYLRRMTSTFADPVNLGTFLSAIFVISWYLKKYKLMFLSLIAIVLTVSKGGLLTIMIFIVIKAFFYAKKKSTVIIAFLGMFAAGVAFMIYSYYNSLHSMFIHIDGFLEAFISLNDYPLGYGVGNVGVLSQITGESANLNIAESGMGTIVGQLGYVGLIVYGLFFASIAVILFLVKDKREKTMALVLLAAIVANIMFNEVALSPNSCGTYMIILGMVVGRKMQNQLIEE